MDYSTFKNSIMISDQSAWQQVEFTLVQPKPIDIFGFLMQQQITVYAPSEAKKELGFQAYQPNLFSGVYGNTDSPTTLEKGIQDTDYVFSRTNGSLTSANLQPNGLNVYLVESRARYSSTFRGQLSLWDATPMMQKLLRNRRSPVDPANILLARCFQNEGRNIFVFVNDQKQIDQLKYEGIKYLRLDKFFAWMCKTDYIDPRKVGWNFRKRQAHNNEWTKPSTNFKDDPC